MSTWSEGITRGTVLRGGAASVARPARMDAELGTTPYAGRGVVDARLTDPHLAEVVERARRDAVRDGQAEGFAEGYAAGLATGAAEAQALAAAQEQQRRTAAEGERVRAAEALAVLTGAAAAFRDAETTAVEHVEGVVVELALQIARAVLGREVATAADPGADALRRALALAPRDAPVTARLHPDDVAALADVDALAPGRGLLVVADPAVARGGCVLDAAGRHVDAQVEPALQRVAEVLR